MTGYNSKPEPEPRTWKSGAGNPDRHIVRNTDVSLHRYDCDSQDEFEARFKTKVKNKYRKWRIRLVWHSRNGLVAYVERKRKEGSDEK